MGMSIWEAFVASLLNHAPVVERRSRYADKPALFLERREVAHLEAPDVIDLRLTRPGWTQLRDRLGGDAQLLTIAARLGLTRSYSKAAANSDRLCRIQAALRALPVMAHRTGDPSAI